ncbi:MAG: transglutaminase domain-containing protein, partial [Candidatus Odinarchaeota archaeon]|nr:transglutaminase domain-containing protein [Candidatus Odinarchaeota archaeon]
VGGFLLIQSIQYSVLKHNRLYKKKNKVFKAGETIVIEAVVRDVLNQEIKTEIINPFNIPIFNTKTVAKSNSGRIMIKFHTTEVFFPGEYRVIFSFSRRITKSDSFILENPTAVSKQVTLENFFIIKNNSWSPIFDIRMDFILPKHIQGSQEIKQIRIYGNYQRRITDFEDNTWVRTRVGKLEYKENVKVGYYAVLRLKQNVLSNSEPLKIAHIDTEKRYLKSEPHIETDHQEIRKICRKIDKVSKSIREFIINSENWIHANIKYRELNDEKGAKFAIERRYGDCTEFSALFVALCRCKGIPARLVGGYGYSATKKIWEPHAWAECYLNEQWITIEPTWRTHFGIIGYTPDRIATIYGNWMSNRVTKDFTITYKIRKSSKATTRKPLEISNKVNILLITKEANKKP